MTLTLFIGGPWHGRYVNIGDDRNVGWTFPLLTRGSWGQFRYVRQRMGCREFDDRTMRGYIRNVMAPADWPGPKVEAELKSFLLTEWVKNQPDVRYMEPIYGPPDELGFARYFDPTIPED